MGTISRWGDRLVKFHSPHILCSQAYTQKLQALLSKFPGAYKSFEPSPAEEVQEGKDRAESVRAFVVYTNTVGFPRNIRPSQGPSIFFVPTSNINTWLKELQAIVDFDALDVKLIVIQSSISTLSLERLID